MRQSDLGFDSVMHALPLEDAEINYYPHYLAQSDADKLFAYLIQNIHWQQFHVTVYGKTHATPRLSAWFGDEGYTYSGLYHRPEPWPSILANTKDQLQRDLKARFNSVLLNYYRDGRDSMGCHSDDEKELGDKPVIASLSLGVSRDFHLSHKSKKHKEKLSLHHGDLLVMAGDTQRFWKHAIHKSARIQQGRINLTFRYIQSNAQV